jgi:hypothetical protein
MKVKEKEKDREKRERERGDKGDKPNEWRWGWDKTLKSIRRRQSEMEGPGWGGKMVMVLYDFGGGKQTVKYLKQFGKR